MRISNRALCNTHRAHAAQIKLIHIDLNKGEQSYIGILLAELAVFPTFYYHSKTVRIFFNYQTLKTNILFYSF